MALTFRRISPIPNFTTICERQPLSTNWLDATKALSGQLTGKHNASLALEEICRQLIERGNLPSNIFNGAKASYVTNPHIQNITDLDLPMPLIVFPESQEGNYRKVYSGERSPVAFSAGINYASVLNKIGISCQNPIRALRVAVACEGLENPGVPFQQNIDHEITHGLDPNLEYRMLPPREPQQELLSELVAVVGELARKEDEHVSVNASSGFWSGYLANESSSGFFDSIGLGGRGSANTVEVCNAISNTIKILTRKYPNSEVVRLFMNSTSFSELHGQLQQLMPDVYPSSENLGFQVRRVSPPNDSRNEIQEVISLMKRYYEGWPETYITTPRSIESFWQQPQYGEHAMQLFVLLEKTPFHPDIFKSTLDVFEKISGRSFDKNNISNFHIQREQLPGGHLIKVSW